MANQIVGYTMMRVALATLAFCLSVSFAAYSQGPTTAAAVPAAVAAGPSGSLFQREALLGAPDGAAAYRILYRSTGLNNEPILVSGAIIIPPGAPPPDGRLIVAWAHPTSGVQTQCAPSLARSLFRQIQGLRAMVELGYVVVATDYPGLGTPETHPYLVGVSEGRAVLDSVRAARQMPEAAVGSRFAVWGHSQGGQAALYTGLIAKDYAPELTLVGVAAAAPATDLVTLVNDDFDSVGGKNLTAMTLWSWARVYNAPIDRVVTAHAMPVVNRLAGECIESIFDLLVRRQTGRPLEQNFLSVQNLTAVEPWRGLLTSNTPGALPPGIPVFLAQGDADQLVKPAVTRAYMRRLCQAGSRVRMVLLPGVGHGFVARDSAAAAVAWMTDRFAAVVPPNDCSS